MKRILKLYDNKLVNPPGMRWESKKRTKTTFLGHRFLYAFWSPFGSLLAPFGRFSLPFGSTLVAFGTLSAPFWAILATFWPLLTPFWILSAPFFIKNLVFWVPEFAKHLQIAVRTSIKGNLPCMHAFPPGPERKLAVGNLDPLRAGVTPAHGRV